ncbi:MAG: hypothetical protein ABIG85_08130 [Chloroflexota bacterium]
MKIAGFARCPFAGLGQATGTPWYHDGGTVAAVVILALFGGWMFLGLATKDR